MSKRSEILKSIRIANKILENIYFLTGRHKGCDNELNKATDAIYKYIDEIKQQP